MPGHWFRITFAANAFRRSLQLPLESLSPRDGIRAMLGFALEYTPQHAHIDDLLCSWGPQGDRFEFAITRRMQRDGQPESPLSLVFEFALTPSRTLSGETGVTTLRDATATEGYRAIARAAVLGRRISPP